MALYHLRRVCFCKKTYLKVSSCPGFTSWAHSSSLGLEYSTPDCSYSGLGAIFLSVLSLFEKTSSTSDLFFAVSIKNIQKVCRWTRNDVKSAHDLRSGRHLARAESARTGGALVLLLLLCMYSNITAVPYLAKTSSNEKAWQQNWMSLAFQGVEVEFLAVLNARKMLSVGKF